MIATSRLDDAARQDENIRVVAIHNASSAAQLDALRALFREYERWVDVPCCFAEFERELAELPGEYAPPSGALLLAEVDGTPAGCAAVRQLGAGACEMKRLFVRPAYRQRGVGGGLVDAAIAAGRAAGCSVIRLDTLPKMAPAIALYRARGFAPRGPYAPAPAPGALFFELALERAPRPVG